MRRLRDRARGALVGLAVGDALGAQVEFSSRGSFPLVTEMLGGGPHQLPPGCWTDDTSMALHLAESIVEHGDVVAEDVARRWVRWMDDGALSSTGRCFDIGRTTSEALRGFAISGKLTPSCGESSCGNGSIMRLAPVAIAWHSDPVVASAMGIRQGAITHGHPICNDACSFLAYKLAKLLHGERLTESPLVSMAPVMHGALTKEAGDIRGSGYVIESLEAALWCLHHTASFEEAVVQAVNLGDDADTTGAVVGQLAGAWYGESAIPHRWISQLHSYAFIRTLADRLLGVEP